METLAPVNPYKRAMSGRKVIAICQSGGEFVTNKDGTLSYNGGDAHAIDIDDGTTFQEFKLEIAEMWNSSHAGGTMSIKYLLPGNKRTLITISNDKDLKRMITFHGEAVTADVFVLPAELVAAHGAVSNMPGSRSSRTTASEAVIPYEHPNVVDDTPIDIAVDKNYLPSISFEAKHHKATKEWENIITGVNQRFSSAHEFRETLRKYSIAHGFAYVLKKNDPLRVTAKCKSEGCPWRVHASRLSTTPFFCIKKMNPEHTCEGSVVTSGYQATTSWVASIIKDKLQASPNYKPKDIAEDFKRDYGIELKYAQAWRGKEIAREQLQGSYEEAYKNFKKVSHEVKRLLVAEFYVAAYAPRVEVFHRSMEGLKSISPEAYNWVLEIKPEHWANAYFEGARYNHMTSNLGELFYSWVSEAHELPITQLVDAIRGRIMELIYTRRVDCNNWSTRLTPLMEEKLQKETLKAHSLQVLFSPGSTFEVRGDAIYLVDIDSWDCTCKEWHITGLPCSHAIAVFECIGRNPYDYCSRYFTVESYRLTYLESVNPVPNIDKPVEKDSPQAIVKVTPPPTRRAPGRPKMKRAGSLMKFLWKLQRIAATHSTLTFLIHQSSWATSILKPQFEDDLMFFTCATVENALATKNLLSWVELMSRLKINLSHSKIYGVGKVENIVYFVNILGCEVKSFRTV
ncbi:hypothetical protein IFM89_000011 [Coptis chinensis]|uniref:SWIM-type domain-containing protein n=1 Tax=Coptis chinensis TaxID=261450 RepID=A0A835IHK6_9MAGN|nr:hypothetical protein IFM89_000011 [Coptis chinensis]